MKKLLSLRTHVLNACPELKINPDKLLTFVRSGEIHNTPRTKSLAHDQSYTAVLVLTDFSSPIDTVTLPILAWLQTNQPDRADITALEYEAEILDTQSVDVELRIKLSESITVTHHENGTVTPSHLGEPVYIGDQEEPSSLSEWERTNGFS